MISKLLTYVMFVFSDVKYSCLHESHFSFHCVRDSLQLARDALNTWRSCHNRSVAVLVGCLRGSFSLLPLLSLYIHLFCAFDSRLTQTFLEIDDEQFLSYETDFCLSL